MSITTQFKTVRFRLISDDMELKVRIETWNSSFLKSSFNKKLSFN